MQIEDPPQSRTSKFNGREIICQAFMKDGVNQPAAEIMVASLADATLKQYESSLHQWQVFTGRNNIDFLNSERNSVLEFLMERFNAGASYGKLNFHRSAISLISSQRLGGDKAITRFLKGVFRLKPARPKYTYTWDTSIVLDYLEKLYPVEELSLKDLTRKIAMLMALSSAHRGQTLTNIKIGNIDRS